MRTIPPAPWSVSCSSPFALLIPASGLASGVFFLGASLAPLQIGGVALVFAGLVVNVYGPKLLAWLTRKL